MAFQKGNKHGKKFQKGEKGGPGRPRNNTVLSLAYKEKLKDMVPDDPEGRTFCELIADSIVIDAIKGRNKIGAAKELADRTEGTTVKHEHSGPVGGPIKLDAKSLDELAAQIIEERAKRADAGRERI